MSFKPYVDAELRQPCSDRAAFAFGRKLLYIRSAAQKKAAKFVAARGFQNVLVDDVGNGARLRKAVTSVQTEAEVPDHDVGQCVPMLDDCTIAFVRITNTDGSAGVLLRRAKSEFSSSAAQCNAAAVFAAWQAPVTNVSLGLRCGSTEYG